MLYGVEIATAATAAVNRANEINAAAVLDMSIRHTLICGRNMPT